MFAEADTAIIRNEIETKAINVMISPDETGNYRLLLTNRYPNYQLIALVPGQHAAWIHVFNTK